MQPMTATRQLENAVPFPGENGQKRLNEQCRQFMSWTWRTLCRNMQTTILISCDSLVTLGAQCHFYFFWHIVIS
jgi:hypothetical protein